MSFQIESGLLDFFKRAWSCLILLAAGLLMCGIFLSGTQSAFFNSGNPGEISSLGFFVPVKTDITQPDQFYNSIFSKFSKDGITYSRWPDQEQVIYIIGNPELIENIAPKFLFDSFGLDDPSNLAQFLDNFDSSIIQNHQSEFEFTAFRPVWILDEYGNMVEDTPQEIRANIQMAREDTFKKLTENADGSSDQLFNEGIFLLSMLENGWIEGTAQTIVQEVNSLTENSFIEFQTYPEVDDEKIFIFQYLYPYLFFCLVLLILLLCNVFQGYFSSLIKEYYVHRTFGCSKRLLRLRAAAFILPSVLAGFLLWAWMSGYRWDSSILFGYILIVVLYGSLWLWMNFKIGKNL